MLKLTFKLAVTLLFAFQAFAVAQTQSAAAPPKIKTSISIDSTEISRGKPAIVTITIENVSGQELELSAICSFDLYSLSKEAVARKHHVFGDSYWSPADITKGTPTELTIMDPEKLKQGIVVGKVPQVPLKFAKDETKTFKVDLTRSFWNASMSSMWPEENLFKVVPKGAYSLSFRMSKKGVNVTSNAVEVSVK